ncbi:hypothetical protein SUDANB182_06087 [Streptomyces sp. SudanB182_2057]
MGGDAAVRQRVDQGVPPGAVGPGHRRPVHRAVLPQVGHGALQQQAHPAGAEALAAAEPVHGDRVPGEDGEAQVGAVCLGGGADEGPVAGDAREGVQRQVDDAVAVVVLDEHGARVLAQHRAQGTRARGGHRGAGRVLRPVGDDQRAGPGLQCAAQVVRARSVVVHADRGRVQAERGDEVQEAAPAGVLDGDRVTGPEVGGEDAFDGVEGAGGHGQRARGDAVGVEFCAGEPGEVRVHGVVAVADGPPVALSGRRREGRGQAGQQGRVGVARGQVAPAGGHLDAQFLPAGGGRLGADPAAPAAGRLDHPAFAQDAIGGGDRVRVHPQPGRQLP